MEHRTWSTRFLYVAAACSVLACARSVRVESDASGAAAVTPATTRTLPTGVELQIALDQAIGTRQSRVGQEFTATVQSPVYAENGRVAVPAGAKVYGHVTGLHPGTIEKPAAIRLDFDRLAFNQRSYPFEASIESTDLRNARESGVRGRDVATGAVAGGVLGAILGKGDIGGILGGAVLGAGVGTVISLGTRGTDATLPSGARMTVRTTQSVVLR